MKEKIREKRFIILVVLLTLAIHSNLDYKMIDLVKELSCII